MGFGDASPEALLETFHEICKVSNLANRADQKRTRGERSEYEPLKPKLLGKKEAARLAAENAAQGSDWADLVDASRAN